MKDWGGKMLTAKVSAICMWNTEICTYWYAVKQFHEWSSFLFWTNVFKSSLPLQASLQEKMASMQKTMQMQASESSTKTESLHTQLQEFKRLQQDAEAKCIKLQAALDDKAEKLNSTQQKLQVKATRVGA